MGHVNLGAEGLLSTAFNESKPPCVSSEWKNRLVTALVCVRLFRAEHLMPRGESQNSGGAVQIRPGFRCYLNHPWLS